MIVVDSSAVVAIVKDEPDASEFARRLAGADRCVMSAASWLEAAMVCEGRDDRGRSILFDAVVATLGIEVVPFTADQARIARDAFKRYGKGRGGGANLNFGDCFAYALAVSLDAPLLYKGDDFSATDLERA